MIVGGDVLIGLECWETLVLEHPEVDKLLNHMSYECNAVLHQGCRLVGLFDGILPLIAFGIRVWNM